MNESRVAPVKEGEVYDVTINSVGGKGDGIARIKGFVVFVPQTKQGDNVKVKIVKVLPSVAFGEVLATLTSAPVERRPKFATISQEELQNIPERSSSSQYQDTEDF